MEKLLYEHVSGEKNKNFNINDEGGKKHTVKLVDIEKLGDGEDGRRDPFSLVFQCSKGSKLEQGVYTVEHGKLGGGGLLLVPIHPDHVDGDPEHDFYEAVFA